MNSNILLNIPAQPLHSEIKMSSYQVLFSTDFVQSNLQELLNKYHI